MTTTFPTVELCFHSGALYLNSSQYRAVYSLNTRRYNEPSVVRSDPGNAGSTAPSFPHQQSDITYLLAIERVDPLHDPTFKFNGLRDVGEHLLEGVRRFLIEQHADRLAWLHAAAHHRHQLGPDEVLALSGLAGSLGSQGLHVLLAGRGLHIHGPVRVDVLRVVDLFVEVL